MSRTSYVIWTAADEARLRELVGEGVLMPEIASRMGRTLGSIKNKVQGLGLSYRALAVERGTAQPSGEECASGLSTKPVTLEELLATFGLDPAEWEAVEVTPNIWQMGAKHPETGEILTAPLYQLKARVRRREAAMSTLLATVLEEIRADTAARSRIRLRPFEAPADPERHALEVCVFDLHIGKLAWDDETGHGHYDATIAAELARQAVDDLLAQSRLYHLDRIILPIGNDLLHTDGLKAETSNGTRQDADSRWYLMFNRARSLVSWMIERCAQRAPVDVIVVQGNHDKLSSWTLGQVLAAEYANDPRVTFDDSPRKRKYTQYGRNLIGYGHGDTERLASLPQTMALEQKHLWAATDFREWHLGHRHHQKKLPPILVDDKEGVTVRMCRSLSAPDAWHADSGWIGAVRGAEAFLWRHSGGMRAHFNHCVSGDAPGPRAAVA